MRTSNIMDETKSTELIGEMPGMKPPPGVIPNLTNPPTMQHINLLCQITCLSVSTICVLIRMYTKIFIDRSHGWEDYTCFLAWLGLLAFSGFQLHPIFTQFPGVHQWNVKIKYLGRWGRVVNIMEIIYCPTIFLAKLSILLLYFRVFVTARGSKTLLCHSFHYMVQPSLLSCKSTDGNLDLHTKGENLGPDYGRKMPQQRCNSRLWRSH